MLKVQTIKKLPAIQYHYRISRNFGGTNTVRGKILEGENFGELMALKSLARKNLANLLVVY